MTDVYGDKMNTWHDTSFESGDGDSFAYSTEKGTVMYGKDLDQGDFFSLYTKEKYYMEFSPEKNFKHTTLEEAKSKALQLLKLHLLNEVENVAVADAIKRKRIKR